MGQTSLHLEIEQLDLLPQTHAFFDTKNSRGISIFLGTIIFVIIGFLIWSFIAKMDDVVKTTAILRPVEDISECKSLCSGQVVFKDYEQNKKVKKGDLLLTVDVSSEENDLKILNEQKAKYNSDLKLYKDLLYCIEEDSIFNEKQISSNIYFETYFSEYNKLKLQILDLQTKYDSELNMPENLKIQNRINEAKNQLEQAEYALQTWKNNKVVSIKEIISNNEEKINNCISREKSVERIIKNSNIYAPIDGIVNIDTTLNIGDYLLSGTSILRIIPNENQNIKAEIYLEPSKIARVEVGKEINFRFPGLPPSEFGQLKGIINLIPADLNIIANNPFFIIEAEIPEPYLYSSKGEKITLRTGLSAEARIIISTNTVFKMILKKLDFIN